MTVPNMVVVTATSTIIALTFTPADTLTIIAAVGVLIAGVGAVIVNIIVALRTGKIVKDAEVIRANVDLTLAKTKEIGGHVNSAATALEGKLDTMLAENTLLRELLAEKKETAAVLAQAEASRPLMASPVAGPVLEDIEQNTSDTAAGVAKLKKELT